MARIENLLLDLDGTLTDSKEGITKSIQYALDKMGMAAPTMDELEWVIGPPLYEIFETLLNSKDRAYVQTAVDYYRERYKVNCAIENKLYDRIGHTLDNLVVNHYRLYLATSKPWLYAEKILEHFNLSHYFVDVHGSELDGVRDYKTDLIKYIIDRHQLDKASTLMVGDRRYDIDGAKNNNIAAIAVTYGYGSLSELTSAQPDFICHRHEDILSILSQWV